MKVIFSKECLLHDPPFEVLGGQRVPYFEKPERLTIIENELRSNGFEISEELDPDIELKEHILRVHSADYLDYLETAYETWVKQGGNEISVLPEAFPHVNLLKASPNVAQTTNAIARAGVSSLEFTSTVFELFRIPHEGLYCFDLSCPITKDTHKATLASLRVTLTAAKLLSSSALDSIFALCRPPGHHAMPSLCAGYCFLNNIAIAARFIQHTSSPDTTKPKVAILDIDYHHGNGSQAAFYDDPSVLYVSLHGENDYPYFTGFTDEQGSGEGEGYNFNFPLPRGTTGDDEYCETLQRAVAIVQKFEPAFVLVSLGVDTFIDDPISDFKVTTSGYLRIGGIIASIHRPTLFVMEGGYALESIGKNVSNILRGFESK
ncbi:Arginase/deacetylase [Schizopora paradoxa]|uniref:Arginase/deacetylase n=1 Tax=Schizopora paradoxa TaxID=27342 RepID=A0A0H2S8K7_9AGAM|nr:Arginase/deacetylase [Schizopora paradoxa]